jgi:hypothetical protein
MTENTKEAARSDFVLEILVSMVEWAEKADAADSGKTSIGITLNVGGLLISGELISTSRYMSEFLGGAIRDKIKSVLDEREDLKRLVEDAPEKKDDFIHLREARFFVPSQRPIPGASEGVLWRGALDSVDGFFIGRLDVAERA